MTDRERIGNRIQEIRTKKGLSTYKLAEMTGFEQSNISRIESGRYSTGIDILSKIAHALGCEIDFVESEIGKYQADYKIHSTENNTELGKYYGINS